MTKQELGELVIASEDTMYRIAKSILKDDTDCEDAIQEAIVKAFENFYVLKNDSYAKTWLIRIVINECYTLIRKQSKVFVQDTIPEQAAPEQTDHTDLYDAIRQLETEDRIAIVLYYFEDYKVREIAKVLDTTVSAVKNRLLRARKKLKAILSEADI